MATPNPAPNKNDFDNLYREYQRLFTRFPPLILPREQKDLIYNLVIESKEYMTNDVLRNRFFSIISNIYLYAPLDTKQLKKLDELRTKIPRLDEFSNEPKITPEMKAEFNKQLEQFCIFFVKQKPKESYRSYEEYKGHLRDVAAFFTQINKAEQISDEMYRTYLTRKKALGNKQMMLDDARYSVGSVTGEEMKTLEKEVDTLEDETKALNAQRAKFDKELTKFKETIIMKIQLVDMLPEAERAQAMYEILVEAVATRAPKDQVEFLTKHLNDNNHPLLNPATQLPSYITLDSIQQLLSNELVNKVIKHQIKINPEPWAKLLRSHLSEHSSMKFDDSSLKQFVAILKEIQGEKDIEQFKKAFAPELNLLRWKSVGERARADSVGDLRRTGSLLAQRRPSLATEPSAHTPPDQSPISPVSKNSPAAPVLRMSSIISPPIAQPAASTDTKPPEPEKHRMGKNG